MTYIPESTLALVAMGANLPHDGHPPEVTLRQSLQALAGEGLVPAAVSRFYRTPCFPVGAGPDYVNAAATIVVPAGMGPAQVLAALHRVEAAFGRERMRRWAGRTLDLDLLALGALLLPDAEGQRKWRELPPARQSVEAPAELILPHPRLQDRAFVLVPLADVAAGWRHPATGQSVGDMLAALPAADRDAVIPL